MDFNEKLGKEDMDYCELEDYKIKEFSKKVPSIFESVSNINCTSYLNWRVNHHKNDGEQIAAIGKAYFDTAHFLLEECIVDNGSKKADYWIFPIMFNIVHGIECYLKAINYFYDKVFDETPKIKGRHDILQLCNIATAKCTKTDENEDYSSYICKDEVTVCLKLVKNFIDNIYKKTNDMTFARYPMDKDKNGHFYINVLGNVTINIYDLHEQIHYVYGSLNEIVRRFDLYFDDLSTIGSL